MRVDINGCDPSDDQMDSGFEWEDDSDAKCKQCGWTGTANDAASAAQEQYPELGGSNA